MRSRTILAPAAALPMARPARAWQPDRPLRLVIPFVAGGPADLFGRVFAEALSARLGKPVVAENRSGAGGVLGVDAVAKAAPDGYTLALTTTATLAIIPAMPVRMPFDAMRDLSHLTLVVRVPEVLAVKGEGGEFRTLAELIAAARARPGGLQFGSSGVGSITHLACELLAAEAKLDVVHVPYRGIAPAVTDLLGGRVHFVVADVPVLMPHITAGTLRPLAVTTANRVASLPDVPTTAELGMPSVVSDNWYGLGVPAATPRPIQDALHAAALEALRDETLVRQFTRVDATPSPMSREQYMDFIQAEQRKWAPVVRATGVNTY